MVPRLSEPGNFGLVQKTLSPSRLEPDFLASGPDDLDQISPVPSLRVSATGVGGSGGGSTDIERKGRRNENLDANRRRVVVGQRVAELFDSCTQKLMCMCHIFHRNRKTLYNRVALRGKVCPPWFRVPTLRKKESRTISGPGLGPNRRTEVGSRKFGRGMSPSPSEPPSPTPPHPHCSGRRRCRGGRDPGRRTGPTGTLRHTAGGGRETTTTAST